MALLNSLLPSFVREPSVNDTVPVNTLRPLYQVQEQDEAFKVTVKLPGVTKENLNITDENGTLTIRGERSWKQPSEWAPVYRETAESVFSLSLFHDNVVDADKAQAELKDGVLTLTLPKSEARKPRKIAIA